MISLSCGENYCGPAVQIVNSPAQGATDRPGLPALLRRIMSHNQGMSTPKPYLSETEAPGRDEIDALQGLTLLEFGTNWCGHCLAAQPAIVEVLSQHPQWHHIKVEDGAGRPLGRSYRVKLWPTLVLMRDGQEVARLVRPTQTTDISAALNIV